MVNQLESSTVFTCMLLALAATMNCFNVLQLTALYLDCEVLGIEFRGWRLETWCTRSRVLRVEARDLVYQEQRQKFVAVKKAKYRGTATSENAKNRGNVAVKIRNIAVVSR